MPIRVVHLLDEHAPEDAARLCSLLLRRLPADNVSPMVTLMGPPPAGLSVPEPAPILRAPKPLLRPFLWARPLQRKLSHDRPDAIIAWSAVASAAAGPAWRGRLATVVSDPSNAHEASRWLRAAQTREPFEVICTSQIVRKRLVEAGIPLEATAVIRPAVDFSEIRQNLDAANRAKLGLPESGRAFLTISPPSREGGQYLAVWAMAILHHIWPDACLIVPGISREQRRIQRLVENIYCPQAYRFTGNRCPPAELLAVADALLVPAVGDVPTAWLAWAMSAGVPIIGSAVASVAEYIADRHNGFLCKPGEPHTLAVRIRTAFESRDLMAQCVRTARQQAYEAFRAERCVDEFLKLIRNLAAGRPALAGVQDAAIDA